MLTELRKGRYHREMKEEAQKGDIQYLRALLVRKGRPYEERKQQNRKIEEAMLISILKPF